MKVSVLKEPLKHRIQPNLSPSCLMSSIFKSKNLLKSYIASKFCHYCYAPVIILD